MVVVTELLVCSKKSSFNLMNLKALVPWWMTSVVADWKAKSQLETESIASRSPAESSSEQLSRNRSGSILLVDILLTGTRWSNTYPSFGMLTTRIGILLLERWIAGASSFCHFKLQIFFNQIFRNRANTLKKLHWWVKYAPFIVQYAYLDEASPGYVEGNPNICEVHQDWLRERSKFTCPSFDFERYERYSPTSSWKSIRISSVHKMIRKFHPRIGDYCKKGD